ncbi:MAG: protein phosphatase 2C domain-containing protein [Prevotellaceae bacterium]|jgi:serine/threonine protein phosphatase PrpC|nr:protein phosphatase 2C domain-containing protein [Prevotellaceae bacterium]
MTFNDLLNNLKVGEQVKELESSGKLEDFVNRYKAEIEDFLDEKLREYSQKVENDAVVAENTQDENHDENQQNSLDKSCKTSETSSEDEQIQDKSFELNVQSSVPEDSSTSFLNSSDLDQKPVIKNHYVLNNSEKARNNELEAMIKSKYIKIDNGKVNQEYCFKFEIEKFIPEIATVKFLGLEDIGLAFDPETKLIKGKPNKSGDHRIKMQCKRKDWVDGKPVFDRDIILIINPDPRSLWKNITTPTDIDYYKPDEAKEFVAVAAKKTRGFLGIGAKEQPRKNMVAASQRGRSHAHEGKPRDDHFKLSFNHESEWYVMVVADGAGSARYSREGSRIACETVIEYCNEKIAANKETFEQRIKTFHNDPSQEMRNEVGKILYEIAGHAAFTAYKNIVAESKAKGAPLKDYSTTLILSVCKRFDFGWFVGAFWVGDGGIGIYGKENGFLKILGEADGGEFAGQTRFLTMQEIMQSAEIYRRLRFDIVPDFTALILMTDGVTDPKFETDANLKQIDKWHDLWHDLSQSVDFSDDNAATADQLLTWLDFWSQGNHDDRTIAILY